MKRISCLDIVFASLCFTVVTVSYADVGNLIPETLHELQTEAIKFCKIQRQDGLLPPLAFTTDRCSLWPDGDWYACCVQHDYAYWCGGSALQRTRADKQLRRCIKAKGYPLMGRIMQWGVRFGGLSILPVPWRWGYGWNWPEDGS